MVQHQQHYWRVFVVEGKLQKINVEKGNTQTWNCNETMKMVRYKWYKIDDAAINLKQNIIIIEIIQQNYFQQ